ncbi:MAG: hypothetical protein LBL39_06935 [Planctomycetaceae bacterium]|jgi:hypothetical protein|nr:hypothetical protein [Planctomycetaceae bacterium]
MSEIYFEAAEKVWRLRGVLGGLVSDSRLSDIYLVRILFCFFAEVSGIFESGLFVNYILRNTDSKGENLALHLNRIFETLNTPNSQRPKTIDCQLNKFPYIGGGLFDERFDECRSRLTFTDLNTTSAASSRAKPDFGMCEVLVECCFIDWGKVSPEIFGEVFQSMINNNKRHVFGVHYTSEENILKLIKPLFLDDLWEEFYCYKKLESEIREKRLTEFCDKLSRLKFLDPSCGCGNFLVICYRELRMIEVAVLRELAACDRRFEINKHAKVSIGQFYGIEISEFASRIAQIAMYLMDNRMNKYVCQTIEQNLPHIVFNDSVSICCGNAFDIDWGEVVPKSELSYILGNPPFLGARLMNAQQKIELSREFCKMNKCRELDYVTAWFKKAAVFIRGTEIEVAFVSTNSICQGEQVSILWRELMETDGVKINFAHQTFKWYGGGSCDAAVYCVIVGFSLTERETKRLFLYEKSSSAAKEIIVQHINAYLAAAENVFIDSRALPICDVPKINFGNQPIDGGFLLLTAEEREQAISCEPAVEKFIRRYVGGREFINNIPRYCLWLEDADLNEFQSYQFIAQRLELVKNFRANSSRRNTRELATKAWRFAFVSTASSFKMPEVEHDNHNVAECLPIAVSRNDNSYIIIPAVSSERREYLPIGFMSGNVIASNACLVVPDGTLYLFAVLSSRMHNVWMRYVCGRLEMRYRYSASVVYNNFPFPDKPPAKLLAKTEKVAQDILNTRAMFANKSIAELYDPRKMPSELSKLHRKLDKLIDQTYGQNFNNDSDRIAFLFKLLKNMGIPQTK